MRGVKKAVGGSFRLLSVVSLGLLFAAPSALAADFKQCKVQGIRLKDGRKFAELDCHKGSVRRVWRSMMREIAHMAPSVPPECKLDDLASQIKKARDSLSSMSGWCESKPQVESVTISDIEANLTFFYMALKDKAILRDVYLQDDKLVSARLTRGGRKAGRFHMRTKGGAAVEGAFSTMDSLPAGGERLFPDGVDVGGVAIREMGLVESGSAGMAGPNCQGIAQDLEYQLADLRERLKYREREKSQCQGELSLDDEGQTGGILGGGSGLDDGVEEQPDVYME